MRATINLPKPLAEELDQVARELRVPKGRLIRQAIERRIRVARFESLARRWRRRAKKQGIVSEQQIFEMMS